METILKSFLTKSQYNDAEFNTIEIVTAVQRLALTPYLGQTVYDTNAKSLCTYNSVNWLIPSFIHFSLDNDDNNSPSVIFWDNIGKSSDGNIDYSNVGTFSFGPIGSYIVNCSATFKLTSSDSEHVCKLSLKRQGTGTVIVSAYDQVIAYGESYGNCSISYVLKTTTQNESFFFHYSSSGDNNVILDQSTHGYIHRIS